MFKKYFEFKGMRYDMGTKVMVRLSNGEIKETTYFGYGKFENIAPDAECSVVEIVSPKYFIETVKKN